MKSFWGIGLFVMFGLLTAAVIGFYSYLPADPLVYDDEQIGLHEDIVIKFNYSVAENTPKGQAAAKFKHLVEQKTGERVRVELFPNASLYNESDEMEALKNGSVQMIAPSFSNIAEVIPEWMAMDLPFAYPNEEAVMAAFRGKIGEELKKSAEHHGMIAMAFWGNGFRQITSSDKAIVHPQDVRNRKVRIQPSLVIQEQYRSLGAATYPLPFNQIYSNVENGTVDAEENTISNIYSKRLYEVQQHLTVTNHSYLGYGVLMNRQFWEELPPDLQRQIQSAMEETETWANRNATEINRRQWSSIKNSSGMEIVYPDDKTLQEWRTAWMPLYEQFRAAIGPELIDEVERLQREYGGQAPAWMSPASLGKPSKEGS
ncbi:DctP family TRAP transporter solute-binding subunit [Paenibacillus terreus]|uniref:DctP family TRAP transporter solute-binding subunit n=1 Tax=Paenibacillus terreus TaxID=1387834 RepID=A0ABV5B6J8_9BACL